MKFNQFIRPTVLALGMALITGVASAQTAETSSTNWWPLSKTWDGKMQDDASHFSGKQIAGRYGEVVVGGKRDTATNSSRTWNGRTQDDSANFRNGQGVYGRSAIYDIGNPSVSQAQTSKDCCDKMKHKPVSKTYPR